MLGRNVKHKDVIEKLKLNDEYLGNRLSDFFEERNKADYELKYNISRTKAEKLLSDISEFTEELMAVPIKKT